MKMTRAPVSSRSFLASLARISHQELGTVEQRGPYPAFLRFSTALPPQQFVREGWQGLECGSSLPLFLPLTCQR